MAGSEDQHLAEIAALWNAIEERAKSVEQFRGEAIIACINEMRYAGRRIVDVLVSERTGIQNPNFDSIEQLAIAKNFLFNADHDLTDAVLFFTHDHVRKVIKRHGVTKIERLCPEFAAVHAQMDEANRIVTGSRNDRIKRKAEYDRLATEYVPKMMELYKKLTAIRALRVGNDWARILIIFGAVASAASVIGMLLSIWQVDLAYFPPHTASSSSAPASSGK